MMRSRLGGYVALTGEIWPTPNSRFAEFRCHWLDGTGRRGEWLLWRCVLRLAEPSRLPLSNCMC